MIIFIAIMYIMKGFSRLRHYKHVAVSDDTLSIRVSFNKAKWQGREEEITAFFARFDSLDALVAAAKTCNRRQRKRAIMRRIFCSN